MTAPWDASLLDMCSNRNGSRTPSCTPVPAPRRAVTLKPPQPRAGNVFHVESVSDRVNVLRLDDGKVNAIGPAFLDAFPGAWKDATADGRAVVIAGNAKAFSAGLDLKVLPTLEPDALEDFFMRFVRFLSDAYAHPGPVVTAVDGPALAGGAIIALFGDVRFGTARARIGLTEMPVGIPFPGPVLALARAELPGSEIGPAVFRGAIRDGDAAREHGWVHETVTSDALLDEATRVAEELASFNPRAYRLSKTTLRASVPESVRAFEAGEAAGYVKELMHEDTVNAIVSYFQRATRKA